MDPERDRRYFPYQIEQWVGLDQNAQGVKTSTGADYAIARAYMSDNRREPVFLVVTHSSSTSSFHPPPICYEAGGYIVEDERKDEIVVADTAWLDLPVSEEELAKLPEWDVKLLNPLLIAAGYR